MENMEKISIEIISAVGTARSLYIEAMRAAKKGDYHLATKRIAEGDKSFQQGHQAHSELVQTDVKKESSELNILLVHAEDQLMSAETFKILASEFVDLYQIMATKASIISL